MYTTHPNQSEMDGPSMDMCRNMPSFPRTITKHTPHELDTTNGAHRCLKQTINTTLTDPSCMYACGQSGHGCQRNSNNLIDLGCQVLDVSPLQRGKRNQMPSSTNIPNTAYRVGEETSSRWGSCCIDLR